MNPARQQIELSMAIVWSVLVLALCIHQMHFWRSNNLNNDVMALLPVTKHDALVARANENIANAAARDVIVLIGSNKAESAKSAAAVFDARIKEARGLLQAKVISEEDIDAAFDFYSRYRDRVLTAQQKKVLEQSNEEELLTSSLLRLYGVGSSAGLNNWISDPLALSTEWWQSRLGEGMSHEDGFVLTQYRSKSWVVLQYVSKLSAFQLDGVDKIQQLLDAAGNDAKRLRPEIEILNAGVPLHAEAAAVRANWEINMIGSGSLAAVILLVCLAFLKFRPLLLVSGSLIIGVAAGISTTALIFGQVHLMTLVFGASLVGVAEDYGIHYFSSRQGNPEAQPFPVMRLLLPGMWLAFITSALAYLVLGMAPLPGLQQMAVFSASGLLAAFLTVACWFPYLDQQPPKRSWLSDKVSGSLRDWPCWDGRNPKHQSIALLFLIFVGYGLSLLYTEDSLRQLQSSPAQLIKQQQDVSEILGLPSPAQYLLIAASSEEAVLQTEESLKPVLDKLIEERTIRSYNAISDWVPSNKRQSENRALVVRAEKKVLAGVSESLDEQLEMQQSSEAPFSINDWSQLNVAKSMHAQYLGETGGEWGSVVLVNGLDSSQALTKLSHASSAIPGVTLIDRTSEISDLLKQYRKKMTVLLFVAYVFVAFLLYSRYKKQAWRAMLPTIIAALTSLSVSSLLGEPVQLFTVLAHFLILGAGVDYGIFLLEHHRDPSAWLAVCLGAVSTLLAFGLLALSSTPALHTFGLSMLFGVGLSWLLSPCFRLPADAKMVLAH